MAGNVLLTPAIIAKEAALQVSGNLIFAKMAHKEFAKDFKLKVGNQVAYRKPLRFLPTRSRTLNTSPVIEQQGTIIVNSPGQVSWEFNTQDLTMTIDQYTERYIRPAAITLASMVDSDGLLMASQNTFNAVGTAGSAPTFSTLQLAAQRLDEFLVPQNDRYMVVNPSARTSVQSSLTGFFEPVLIEDIVKSAAVGRIVNMDVFCDTNVAFLTTGTATTATLSVFANPADGATAISLADSGSGTLVNGDILTFGTAVHTDAVDPIQKTDLGYLQQFVVVGGTTAIGSQFGYQLASGSGTLVSLGTVSSANVLNLTGPYQTVTALPTTSSTVTKMASHRSNIAWHKNAFVLVTVPLDIPRSVVYGKVFEFDGISMRFMVAYDPIGDAEYARLDILYGWASTYPELACQILG